MNQSLRRKLDHITDFLWGVTNPVTYIKQISYLIYLKRLDEEEATRELRGRLGAGNGSLLFPGRLRASAGPSGASGATRGCATSSATRCSPTWLRW